MTQEQRIEVTLNEFLYAIYMAFGELTDHMQLLVEKYGDGFDFKRIPQKELRSEMRVALLQHMHSLQPDQQQELQTGLQYLLNHDASIPYSVPHPHNPAWREKKGALSQKIRDDSQDAVTPYDGYAMCQWMWEALFGEEDWHADISNWVVVKR